MNAKKAMFLVGVALPLFYVITQPAQAAEAIIIFMPQPVQLAMRGPLPSVVTKSSYSPARLQA